MRHPSAILSLLCLFPLALKAQANSGSDLLTGRVTDFTGRPVADAQVGVTSLGTGLTRSHKTDADGYYQIYFPETAPKYLLLVKRMGFSPVQRTVTRRTQRAEHMTIDLQFMGAPLALSTVEIAGSIDAPTHREADNPPSADATIPNPISEILALRDTLRLSAVQVVALTDLSDSLQAKNMRLYRNIQSLLSKSQEVGDPSQMAGSVALMLEEASGNTTRAVTAAEKLLRAEQWVILPSEIKGRAGEAQAATAKQQ